MLFRSRIYASFKFFLFTLLGSLLMLVAVIAIYLHAGTTDIAALAEHRFPVGMQTWLWLAFFDNEPGAEVYCAATMRAQAKITWDAARQMVLRSALKGRIKALVGNLHELSSASKMVPLGADADGLDGLRPNGVILDEIHAMKSAAMIDVLSTATGPRRHPMIFEITTAGVGQTGVCWSHHEYTSKVLRGIVEDDTWFGSIIGADPEDDWRDPLVWRKANPNLGVSVKAEAPIHAAPSPPMWLKVLVLRSMLMASVWQPMPAIAIEPSGTLVEELCGQPEQKYGTRFMPASLRTCRPWRQIGRAHV